MGMLRIKGYFGDTKGNSVQGTVIASYVSHGTTETLTIGFEGCYQCDLPFRPLEALVTEVRRSAVDTAMTTEQSAVLKAYYSDTRVRLVQGNATVWFRKKNHMEMLTVEFERRGQISLPFAPVAAAIGAERRGRV